MKVLFVVDSLTLGGSGRVITQLANSFHKHGHEVTILLGKSWENNYTISPEIPILRCESHKSAAAEMIGIIKKIRSVIRQRDIDHVVSFLTMFNICAILASKGTKAKVVVSERSDPARSPAGKLTRLMRRLVYPLGDGFVFQTDDAKAYFSKSIRKRAKVILNPLTDSIPAPYEGEKDNRVVSFGRLMQRTKNYVMGIRAFAKIAGEFPELCYEIYGEGPDKDLFQQEIDRCGMHDRIRLMGNSSAIYQDVYTARLFLLPSNYEGLPNSLLEAMALGIPSISTDHPVGGARMMIREGENGMLVPVGDVDALADAMRKVLSDRAQAAKMSENGQLVRQKLRADVISQEWEDFVWTRK